MGNFYTNITVYGVDHDKIVRAMQGRRAVISPTVDGYTVIWDEQCDEQDTDLLTALAQLLASGLSCPAWAVLNHDDDILWYSLHAPARKIDEYDSHPGYFEGADLPPSGGNAALLVATMSPDADVGRTEKILRSRDEYAIAIDRHEALARALGMPEFGVGTGYRYINRGEPPLGLEEESLTFTE